MMDIRVIDQSIFALVDRLTEEGAKVKADELKTKAFGTITGFLMGAKREDIEVTYIEKRYEPFWHILCNTHLEYNRGRQYRFALDPQVRNVVVDGRRYDATNRELVLSGTEHCVEDLHKEVFIDAVTGNNGDYEKYVLANGRRIDQTEELMVGATIVVPAKVKASHLTRNILGEMLKPVPADEILLEEIRIEKLHLYFRPVYAIEYLWKTKDKSATLEVDAVSLGYKSGGKALKQKMKELIFEPDLFDIGADAVSMLVPGGGLALKLARRAMKK
jgi:hypothetical protein